MALRGGLQFYSLLQDLNGLAAEGALHNVPNIAFANVGLIAPGAGGVARNTLMLSFGGNAAGPALAAMPAVLLTGGIHAREWIAPAIAYLIAEYLIVNYTTHPIGPYQTAIRDLVDSRRIYVMPMLNPNGNFVTVYGAGQRQWRKNQRVLPATAGAWVAALTNAVGVPNPPFLNVHDLNPAQDRVTYDVPLYRSNPAAHDTITIDPNDPANLGVDLNRNFSTQNWGQDTYYHGASMLNGNPDLNLYFGPNRHSEVETQNLEAHIAADPGIETAIDYHSYSRFILYPTEAFYGGHVGANYTNLAQMMERLITTAVGAPPNYRLGDPMSLIEYDAVGSISDFLALNGGAAYGGTRAFTVELDPAPGAGPAGFDLPENQIMGVFEKNIRGALALIDEAGRMPEIQSRCCFWSRTVYSQRALRFLNWNVFGRGNQLPV